MKVLIIDDNRIFLENFCDSLTNKCLEVEKTDNPVEALKLLKVNNYDIVITDMNMPLFKGKDILKMVKKVNNNIKVIIYDENINDNEKKECLELGALEVLDKNTLKEKLEDYILKLA